MKHKIVDKLKSLTGQEVRVVAGDDCQDDNGIHFSFYGRLEGPEEDCNRYYIRCRDGFNGPEGVSFHPSQVREICKQLHCWEIELEKNLNASIY